MKWKRRMYKNQNGSFRIVNPENKGDYWVTDGYHVHKAHYDPAAGWGIYQPDKNGLIANYYNLDDMNFTIMAYAKLEYPKNYQKYAKE